MTRTGRVWLALALCAGTASSGEAKKAERAPGLLALYTFDEGTGHTVHDGSGNGNHGRIHGAAFVKGVKGHALQFDGKTTYVDCGNAANLNAPGRELTISVWLKVGHQEPGNRMIVSKKVAWNDNEGYYLGLRADISVVEISGSSSLVARLHGDDLHAGWHHIVATIRDSGRDIRGEAHIDGKKIAGSCLVAALAGGSNRLYLGCCRPGASGHFKGTVDELAIYSRALTSREIVQLYETTRP